MISAELQRMLSAASDIRRLWDLGHELKRVHGADNVADLTLGNPILEPPEELRRALVELVADPPAGLHRYTPSAGVPEVRERIAEHLDRRGLLPGARAEHVLVTSGAAAACNVALRAVLDPGDEVLIPSPHFPDYPAHVRNHGGVPIRVPCTADHMLDLEAVERALGPWTRAIIVNHPNNPTGRQYPEGLLVELADVLRRGAARTGRPIYLISDEPYRELRFTAEPFVSPARLYEHGIMIYSFSKSHCIPGERLGYLALNPAMPGGRELAAGLVLANRILGFVGAPSLWQHVVARCLDAAADLAPLERHRRRLLEALAEKGYEVLPPDGAFYFFPRTPGGDDEAFVTAARERLLLVVPGASFGGPGHFRMAFCVDDRTIDLTLERLPEARSLERA